MSETNQTLHHCDPCPACEDGRLYRQPSPGGVVRIKGTAPLWGKVYELEKLRCNICGKIFTADLPPEAGSKKYDATAAAMLAVLRYGSEMALNRLAGLQATLGVPVAASTSWEVTEKLADGILSRWPTTFLMNVNTSWKYWGRCTILTRLPPRKAYNTSEIRQACRKDTVQKRG